MIQIDIKKPLHGSNGNMNLEVNLDIKKGEFVALMGESGSGKTTLLRVLAGLEDAKGNITVEGKSWNNMPLQYKEIGFVFQDYALFENMSVEENLLFVNNDKKLSEELLEISELSTLKTRNVRGLSGGQKQRVALCRAMMKKPKILLMDEPLCALDAPMRKKLEVEIKALHKRFGMTTIMVSHDVSSVFSLASRVLVLKEGNICSDGTLEEVLLTNTNTHKAEVLKLEEKTAKIIATVFAAGELLEIEIAPNVDIKVGQNINITLKGKQI